MKIDLDELERKARAATQHDWLGVMRLEGGRLIASHGCGPRHPVTTQDADHVTLNSPPVTLALIARIRELEVLADGLIHDLAANMSTARSRELDPERAVLEKGAVLP